MADTPKRILSDKLNKGGQVTMPTEIRELLNIKEGDQLQFNIQDDGTITVTKKILLEEIFGSLRIKDDLKGISFEDERKRARGVMIEEYRRELKQ